MFNSACALNEVRQGFDPRFEVRLCRRGTYIFEQTNGGYVIRDGSGGRWPLQMPIVAIEPFPNGRTCG